MEYTHRNQLEKEAVANIKRYVLFAMFVVIFLVALGTALGSFYTVKEGERGIVTRNGKITAIAEPGLEWKVPFFDSVTNMSIQNQTFRQRDVDLYTSDQQSGKMVYSVTYQLPPGDLREVYTTYQDMATLEQRLLAPRALATSKVIAGKFKAIETTQQRQRMTDEFAAALRQNLEKEPLTIVNLQIEDIRFSEAYEQGIEEQMRATTQINTQRQIKETEEIKADIVVIQAQAEADSRLAHAESRAKATLLQADAEAKSIQMRGDALRSNQEIVALTTAEKWDGKLPAQMVPGSAVPFISLK